MKVEVTVEDWKADAYLLAAGTYYISSSSLLFPSSQGFLLLDARDLLEQSGEQKREYEL